jgi:hypothetical protein
MMYLKPVRTANELFSEFHHVAVVDISLVEFNAGKFWIVAGGNSFVAKDASHFIDFFKSSHEEAFQMQFGGDAEGQVEVHGIVICFKGFGFGASTHGMQDGSFNLQEPHVIELLTKG